jgi:hypothetical protein
MPGAAATVTAAFVYHPSVAIPTISGVTPLPVAGGAGTPT